MILPSAAVILVSSPEIAVAFPVTLVFVVAKDDCRLVISDALAVMFPSAAVTRVSSPEMAEALEVMLPSAVVRSL